MRISNDIGDTNYYNDTMLISKVIIRDKIFAIKQAYKDIAFQMQVQDEVRKDYFGDLPAYPFTPNKREI